MFIIFNLSAQFLLVHWNTLNLTEGMDLSLVLVLSLKKIL